MVDLFSRFKAYQVTAASVEDFRQRYTKPERYAQRGPEYIVAVLESARADLSRFGFTIIDRHDSITGETIAFYQEDNKAGGF